MNREVIDGVTTFWRPPRADDAGILNATLTFGCGIRDEDIDCLGVTHLVAALALAVLPSDAEPTLIAGVNSTSIDLLGDPDLVAARLAALCHAFADPPLDRLPGVVETIDSDDRNIEEYSTGLALHHRFGPHGPGLARWWCPRYDMIRPETVRAYAGRFFVQGNSVLTLDGPPPAGLRLPLPPGPPVDHPTPPDRSGPGPRWFAVPAADVHLSLPAGRHTRWFAAFGVLQGRVESAVAAARLGYLVLLDRIEIDAERMEMGLLAQFGKPRDAPRVAEVMWRELRRLAAEPPAPEEIAAYATKVRGIRVDIAAQLNVEDDWYADDPLDMAAGHLFGDPPSEDEDYPAEIEGTTPAEIAGVAAEWLRTALLVMPPGARPDLPGMVEDACPRSPVTPGGRALRRRWRARLRSRAARQERLVVDPTGLSYVDPTGAAHTIRFTDVLMVEQRGRSRTVTGRNGCAIEVSPELFGGTRRAVRAIDAGVPPQRRLTLW